MADVAVTYSFTGGTKAKASEVNTNYTDITSWLNDRNNAATSWAAGSFAGAVTITPTSSQLVLGTTRTVTITAPTPATSSRTHSIPDISGNGTFAFLEGTQTISGAKTFSAVATFAAGTLSLPSIALNDTNTGFFSGGTDRVDITNGGVNTVTIDGTSFTSAVALTVTPASNQLILGATRTVTITAPTPASLSRTHTIPDVSGNASFVMTLGAQTISGAKTFDGQLIGKGTATNDSAAATYIGEYIESVVQGIGAVSSTGTTQWFDVASISLTAGDWDVTGVVINALAGATVSAFDMGVSTTTGDSATGLVLGSNRVGGPVSTATLNGTGEVPSYRLSLSGSATAYLKANLTYSAGTPTAFGRLSARRVR